MSRLSELTLRPAYHKGQDDIAKDFYLPCMGRAVQYDRAVGYFNSTIYILAWPSLKDFVNRGGRIRIICSPFLTEEDKQAIAKGYDSRFENQIATKLRQEIEDLFQTPFLFKPAKVLASLVALEVIDFRIAVFDDTTNPRHKRLFHDKLGIFVDEEEHAVVFKGSMNETWAGLAFDGNLESIDVFLSWDNEREYNRVKSERQYFETLWENHYPGIQVYDFPEAARNVFLNEADVKHWEQLVDEVAEEIALANTLSAERKPGGRIPRPHQVNALLSWFRQSRRGILEHATGSGKTYTALCAIRDSLQRRETPLVLVPSELLLKQWYAELRETFSDISPEILLCGAGNTKWRTDRLVRVWSKPSQQPRIILSTLQTAVQDIFLKGLSQGEHIFLISDEVHRMGSPNNRKLFNLHSGPRLGLSATPRRAGDPEGTDAVFKYFDGTIDPPFTLADAIKAGTLTPYMYYVHQVPLTDSEQTLWNQQTKKIKTLYARNRNREKPNPDISERIKYLLIERSKIVKTASGKIDVAVTVLRQFYTYGQRWIVYCDSLSQLRTVQRALQASSIPAGEYHSKMEGDREQTISNFEINGGVLVSIRCLDEGVDIPNVTHALILASSKNPREFIQRRGRVLRRAQNKPLAFIHDAIVLPQEWSVEGPEGTAILESELARAIEFGTSAENSSAVTDLKLIAVKHGIDYSSLLAEGYEDEEIENE